MAAAWVELAAAFSPLVAVAAGQLIDQLRNQFLLPVDNLFKKFHFSAFFLLALLASRPLLAAAVLSPLLFW